MAYLIDSDWVIDRLKEDPVAVQLFDELSSDGMYISIVTYMEAYQGALREVDVPTAVSRISDLLVIVPIIHFNERVAERCARIREAVRGGTIRANRRAYDLMIAATSIEHDLTLVTRNVDDFDDVPGIRLHQP